MDKVEEQYCTEVTVQYRVTCFYSEQGFETWMNITGWIRDRDEAFKEYARCENTGKPSRLESREVKTKLLKFNNQGRENLQDEDDLNETN